MFAEACSSGWEGVIAKRADSVYTDKRSRDWLKFKCEHGQEMVDRRVHAAQGLARGVRRAARRRLRGRPVALRRQGRHGLRSRGAGAAGRVDAAAGACDAPFYDAPRFRDVTWIEPSLVAQCGFAEWTNDGRLRHPRYLGLREDKDPLKVVRE